MMLAPSAISAAQCAEVAAEYDDVLRHLEPLVAVHHRDGLDEPGGSGRGRTCTPTRSS